jgi:hypothetical protein
MMSANMYTNGTGHGQPYPAFSDFQANAAPIPWAEVCRHCQIPVAWANGAANNASEGHSSPFMTENELY